MPTRRGTLRVSADGLVAEAVENWGPDLEFGTSYTHIAVDGKKYPFISRTTRTLDSPYATKESDVLLFSYSGFSRMR